MNKLATAFGGLLMIGAVLAPLAMAHGDSGSHALPAPAGYKSYAASGNANVPSGFYYGSASAWAQLNSAPLAPSVGPNIVPGCPTLTGTAVDAIICGLTITPDPSFQTAVADALCDMEVAGTGSGDVVDESTVDASPGNGGAAPDGTFNDGGIGAVCHTYGESSPGAGDGFYANNNYNTNGCSSTNTATAADLVSGTGIWISTSCDSTTPVAGAGLLTLALSAESCAVNAAISGSAGAAPTCLVQFVDCVAGLAGCPPGTAGVTCGADGVSDSANAGFGSGVTYPGAAAGCSGQMAEGVFVWNSLQVTAPNGSGPAVHSLATTGWVQ